MRSITTAIVALTGAALLLGTVADAHADKWNDDLADRVFENFKRRDNRGSGDELKISLDQAANKVRRQYGGKVIGATTRRDDGRSVHYIKLLSQDGKVRTVRVDGRTGRIF